MFLRHCHVLLESLNYFTSPFCYYFSPLAILLSFRVVFHIPSVLVICCLRTGYPKLSSFKQQMVIIPVSVGWEQLIWGPVARVCHEVAVKTSARALEGLTGVGGRTFKTAQSHARHWQDAQHWQDRQFLATGPLHRSLGILMTQRLASPRARPEREGGGRGRDRAGEVGGGRWEEEEANRSCSVFMSKPCKSHSFVSTPSY